MKLELPFIYYTPNMHEGDFGTIDKPRFYRAMLDTKRAFMAAWGLVPSSRRPSRTSARRSGRMLSSAVTCSDS